MHGLGFPGWMAMVTSLFRLGAMVRTQVLVWPWSLSAMAQEKLIFIEL